MKDNKMNKIIMKMEDMEKFCGFLNLDFKALEPNKQEQMLNCFQKVVDDRIEETNKAAEETPKTNLKNYVVMEFESYNERRYSRPWIAMIKDGKFDFNTRVGYYSGNHGEAGALIISEPKENIIYAYGHKDNRGNGGFVNYGKFIDGNFVKCDKAGRTEE